MTTKYVMRCEGFAADMPCPVTKQFLQFYDPNAPAEQGLFAFTPNVAEAILFDDAGQLLECWKQVRSVDPVRPDGKPNRPLTAFSISTHKVEV